MKNNNQVKLRGRLGKSPEIKKLKSGGKLTRFTLAINNHYVNKNGERKSDTQWHTVSAWGKLATIAARVLKKGALVTVDGCLVNYHYTNKAGQKEMVTQVVANELWAKQD